MTSLTIFIDADKYASAKELHLALKMLLDLPEYYGCNADALNDCLQERRETSSVAPRLITTTRGRSRRS